MVGRRQRRETRLQVGEALVVGGLITLVVTPLVYRLHAASKHVVTTRSMWWPTAWMLVPLAALLIGVFVILATSTLVAPRRRRVRTRRAATRTGAVLDLEAEAARENDVRTASRSRA